MGGGARGQAGAIEQHVRRGALRTHAPAIGDQAARTAGNQAGLHRVRHTHTQVYLRKQIKEEQMASTGFVVRVVASHGTASSWMAISAGRHSEDQPILECRRVL